MIWLETIRDKLVAGGAKIDRPIAEDGTASEAISAWQQRIERISQPLLAGLPADVADRSPEQQAKWLLANILDWHRRENKAVWWEYFRLSNLSAEELFDEQSAVSGLSFIGSVGGTAKAPVHRYRFPPQETELRGGEDLKNRGGAAFGQLHDISFENRTVDIKKRMDTAGEHPDAVFSHKIIGTDQLADALARIGESAVADGMTRASNYNTACQLLLRQPPAFDAQPMRGAEESALDAALRIATRLSGVLPIQGPPGTGKTFTGARMICELVRSGARVGVTAHSHSVIRNMLNELSKAADELGLNLTAIQKVADAKPPERHIVFATKNENVFSALGKTCQVAAGTAWLWAPPESRQSVDVLFVDEAAQMSLANVLAASQAARSVVLLGDPQQLEQPTQGSHPEGTDVSALHHLLNGHQTIESSHGLFLEETWRLHPDICQFTSEMFYEGRLKSRAGLENQKITSKGAIRRSGLRLLTTRHTGNQISSPEEADTVYSLVKQLLDTKSTWADRNGREKLLTLEDVLIIAPYNAQVFELRDRLPKARIGTVDKFQGQEAPVVIYSMATSTPADAPHGMEFLYSLNRLNVATSRARCVCVLVAGEDIFEPECRTPRQMQLANAFCRFREIAEEIGI